MPSDRLYKVADYGDEIEEYEVVKETPKTVKVKQVEARGGMRWSWEHTIRRTEISRKGFFSTKRLAIEHKISRLEHELDVIRSRKAQVKKKLAAFGEMLKGLK